MTPALHLCLFSQSKAFASCVVRDCPRRLTMAEHGGCEDRQQRQVDAPGHKSPIRVMACVNEKAGATTAGATTAMATNTLSNGATNTMTAANSQIAKLWPQPLPVVGVTGEYESGKTLFLLTLDPKRTRYYDTEKSAETYEALNLGFTRVDVWKEMLRLHPGGYKPVDIFTWWLEDARKIEPGRNSVIALDTVSEIETGLVDWVRKNPQHFGHTAAQYAKMEALMWGDVKEYWKAILADLASRCQTFAFAAHMGDVWSKGAGGGPTGKRKPKGKETLMELASLYLQMERRPSREGVKPDKPAAVVLKSRLVSGTTNPETGEFEMVATLPARLPVATPHAIRQYMVNPAGGRGAQDGEALQEERMSDDERLRMQAAIAEANRDAEMAKLEQAARRGPPVVAAAAGLAVSVLNHQKAAAPTAEIAKPEQQQTATPITADQVATLKALRLKLIELGYQQLEWEVQLTHWNAKSAMELTTEQADSFIHILERRLKDYRIQHGLEAEEPKADPFGGEPEQQQEGGEAEAAGQKS